MPARSCHSEGQLMKSKSVVLPSANTNRRQILGMLSTIVLLSTAGWCVLAWSVRPDALQANTSQTIGWGVGVTAYLLGVRHAFDADHIAAIDNTTRKLVQEKRPAVSLGFWFSLGHSSVVFLLALLVAIGARSLAADLGDGSSDLKETLSLVGTLVGGGFLILVGLFNLQALAGMSKLVSKMRRETLDEAALERHLLQRGFMAQVLSKPLASVRKPWHMYIIGFAFGIGFDTATEVTLLVVAGGAAAANAPWYAVLVIPVLFAAGMSLFDTADGVLMSHAYRWAFVTPSRKIFYNLTVTALSVIVALGIGGIELLQLLADQFGYEHGPVALLGSVNLEYAGYIVVAAFIATWATAASVWRWGRVERRWSAV